MHSSDRHRAQSAAADGIPSPGTAGTKPLSSSPDVSNISPEVERASFSGARTPGSSVLHLRDSLAGQSLPLSHVGPRRQNEIGRQPVSPAVEGDETTTSASPADRSSGVNAAAAIRETRRQQENVGEDDAGSGEHVCRITAKEWGAVATWSWSVQADSCAICKNSLEDVCVECQTCSTPLPAYGSASPYPATEDSTQAMVWSTSPLPAGAPRRVVSSADACTISWGCCAHVFHTHCIRRWLAERKVCPLCGRPWELYKITRND